MVKKETRKARDVDNTNQNPFVTTSLDENTFATRLYDMAAKVRSMTTDDVTAIKNIFGSAPQISFPNGEIEEISAGNINNLYVGISVLDLYIDMNDSSDYLPMSLSLGENNAPVYSYAKQIETFEVGSYKAAILGDNFLTTKETYTLSGLEHPAFELHGFGEIKTDKTIAGVETREGILVGLDTANKSHVYSFVVELSDDKTAELTVLKSIPNGDVIEDINDRITDIANKGIDTEAITAIISKAIEDDNAIDATLIDSKIVELEAALNNKIDANTTEIANNKVAIESNSTSIEQINEGLADLQNSIKALPDDIATKSDVQAAIDGLPTLNIY